jgi:hypothetical protein
MLAPSGISLSIGLLPRTLLYAVWKAKPFELRFYSLRQLLTSLLRALLGSLSQDHWLRGHQTIRSWNGGVGST